MTTTSSMPDRAERGSAADGIGNVSGPSPGLLIAVIASIGLGSLGTTTLPITLGSIIDELGISERQAGFMGTAELGMLALVSLLLAPKMGRWSRSRAALTGGFFVVTGYGVSALGDTYMTILVGRLIGGAGAGAAMAAGSAAVATSSDPDGLMARVMFVAGISAAILLGALPLAIEFAGFHGVFAALGVVALLCLAFVKNLPQTQIEDSPRRGTPIPFKSLGIFLLLALALDALSQDSLWAFSERIGMSIGLDIEEIGLVLGLSTLAGLTGSVLAAVVGPRIGRAIPLAIGLSLGATARWLLANAEDPTSFTLAQILLGLSFFMTYPFLFGALAALDRTGRWAAAGAGVATLGAGAGPVTAGLLVEWAGFPALGWLGVAMAVCTAALALPAVRILSNEATEPVDPPSKL